MVFNEDFGCMWLKLKFYAKNHLIFTVFATTLENAEIDLFLA